MAPEWEYAGTTRDGKKIQGVQEASNEGDLRMYLRAQGIRPSKIAKRGALNTDLGTLLRNMLGLGIGKVNTQALANFTKQLQTLIGSGIPLVQALEVLGDQTVDPVLKLIVTSSRERVSQGSFFWEALNNYQGSLPRVYISLIRAGESAGALDAVMERLAKYLDSTTKMVRTVKSALTYPVFVIIVAIGVIGIMVGFVIPKFEDMLKQSGGELPWITQALINVSHWFTKNMVYLIMAFFVGGFLLRRYIKTEEGRGVFHRLLFQIPYFGEIIRLAAVSRFARTLGTLLGSGVNLLDAIEICKATVDNAVIEDSVTRLRAEVESGKQLSAVMTRLPAFPKMATQMVGVGEATGNLEKMLDRTAAIYEDDVEVRVGNIGRMIEPFLMVFLGGTVAGIMIAMYLPIFKLASSQMGK